MSDVISGIRILHVSTMAEVLVHFKLPLLEKLSNAGALQSIYCSDEQYCRDREDSYKEGGHMKVLLDLGYDIEVGPVSRRLSYNKIPEIFALSKHIRREKYDMVIAHQSVGALLAIPAARLAGTPVKIISSGGLRVVTLADRLVNKYGEHLMIRLSDAILINNMEDYEYVSMLWGCSKKAHFVSASEGCGVDTSLFSPESRLAARSAMRSELGIDNDETVISFVGRFVWEKGFRELIEAASMLNTKLPGRRLRYLLVGIGPDTDSIIRLVERKGLMDKFLFTGYRMDIEQYFSASDIFVLPSYREGLPTVLLQAMAMGLPCVATNIRGSRELMEDGRCGIIVEPHRSSDLASALTLVINDQNKAEELGRRAAEIVKLKYSRDILLPKTVDTIRKVVEGILPESAGNGISGAL